MKIAVPSLASGQYVFKTCAEARDYADLDTRTGLEFCAPVEVEAVVDRMGEDLYVRAGIRTAARMECARCLEPIEKSIAAAFQILYVPEREEPGEWSGAGRALRESQRVEYYHGALVDLDEYIIEALVLAVPMKVLCRPDCKGLCATCGKNLNAGPCGCAAEPDFGHAFKGLLGASASAAATASSGPPPRRPRGVSRKSSSAKRAPRKRNKPPG